MTQVPSPGAQNISSLTGSEKVPILAGSVSAQTTTAAIAALAALESTAPTITTISTVGAGTLTAAAIIGQNILRTGTQIAAFADTTDTAALIIAALPSGAPVGSAFVLTYNNNTTGAGGFTGTLTGGVGVTVTGQAAIPARSSAEFLVQVASATTVTMTRIAAGFHTTGVGTFDCNGASAVTVADAKVTAGSAIIPTLKTVGGTVGALPAVKTITPGTGFTIAGTASDTSTYNYLILG